MPQSHARVLIHVVFSTKDRRAWIHREIEADLFAYLAATLKALGSPALLVGGTDDHVHILCSMSRTLAIADLVEEVKSGSSKWIKTKGQEYGQFTWQAGYGVFSVAPDRADAVKQYIAGQREHHRKRTFQEEYVAFLKTCGVPYDERYLWK
ncbi:MAG: IS200/IS605 family transposase [Planctomycetes bacterium]|nr:IS200/IS605 family transposase [Planctomycetota bacterium]